MVKSPELCETLRELSSSGLIKGRLGDVTDADYNYSKVSYKDIGAKLSISSQYCYNIARGTGFHLGRLRLEMKNSFSTTQYCKEGALWSGCETSLHRGFQHLAGQSLT